MYKLLSLISPKFSIIISMIKASQIITDQNITASSEKLFPWLDIQSSSAVSNTCYLELSLSRTFSSLPSALSVTALINTFVRYLELRHLKLLLCRTILSVPSALFRAVFFHFLNVSISLIQMLKDTFENFDWMFMFSYFSTTTCQSSKSLRSKVWARNVRLWKNDIVVYLTKKLLKNMVHKLVY